MSDDAELLLEDNTEPAIPEQPPPYIEPWRRAAMPVISICIGGACSQDGAHMALREIEDLVDAVGGGCKHETDWCFGLCGSGPNVLVVKDGQDRFFTGVHTLEETSAAVKLATGRQPVLDAALESRLRRMRRVHALEQDLSRAEMLGHCASCTSDEAQRDRQIGNALAIVDEVLSVAGNAHPLLQAQHLKRQLSALRLDPTGEGTLDCTWHRVACWKLDAVEPRSEWSSVFRFSSSDAARSRSSTAAKRGGAGHGAGAVGPGSRTWHVTLRVELGGRCGDDGDGGNGDGDGEEGGEAGADGDGVGDAPLPEVVLRDYTPLSSEEELENGVLRLLIKVYEGGKVRRAVPVLRSP